ncbi:hypothetical protein SAY87_018162 [Trapa incisa]|uniref:Prephenate/arogenate dehydrogenase domain-containing protein n=1 Tax=Trapa incisa TaxID=236973 RepID=A0AAN7L3K7_9MYRT|nr:hypothetical protein SAY87_018162 [Trapa incisa]
MFSSSSLGRSPPSAKHLRLPQLHRPQTQPTYVLRTLPTTSPGLPLSLSVSLSPRRRHFHRHRSLLVKCIDAAQPYDTEFKLATALVESSPTTSSAEDLVPLKIAIIGFGNFGQFLAKTLTRQGHTVLAHSRSDYFHAALRMGVKFFSDPNDLFEEHPEVILLCTSIISTGQFFKSLPFQRLKRNTLFVDVLSVKEFSKNLMLNVLPADFDIICSHPMFGPESAKLGWKDLFFVYEKVRIGSEGSRVSRCESFLDIFVREGCAMVEMSCAEHDQYAAESQFITHTVGRVLKMLNLVSTPINTKGYEKLLDLVENTAWDSFDLYYGLFMYNKNSLAVLKRLNSAMEALKDELFEGLDDVARKRQYESDAKVDSLLDNSWVLKGDHNGLASQRAASESARSQDAVSWKINGSALRLQKSSKSSNLKIAIIGFGNFGQFLAKTLVRQGHTVLAHSRMDYSEVAESMGISFFSDADDLCEEHPEVILLCTSILSLEKVLKSLPVQRLKRSTLFVDVLSVKEFPRGLFLQNLPPYFDILCTHPMFGPESGKNGWHGLTFVYDKVRIGNTESRKSRCDKFIDVFAQEGCKMEEMSCAEHDRHAAGSQFITHTVGRVLEKLKLEPTPINTRGYETLLNLVENTAGDSFELYYGLFLYNVNAMDQLERLDVAFESLKKQLFQRLHGVIRKQHFKDEVSSDSVQRV